VIKAGDPQGTDTGWLGQFIRLAMTESAESAPGGESVLARLSELMFIEVVSPVPGDPAAGTDRVAGPVSATASSGRPCRCCTERRRKTGR